MVRADLSPTGGIYHSTYGQDTSAERLGMAAMPPPNSSREKVACSTRVPLSIDSLRAFKVVC